MERDAPDRARVGAQLVEHELAACSRRGGRVGVSGCAWVGASSSRCNSSRACQAVRGGVRTEHGRAPSQPLSTGGAAGGERDAPERRVVHGLENVVQRLVQAARHEELAQKAGRQVDGDQWQVRQSRERLRGTYAACGRARDWHAYGACNALYRGPARSKQPCASGPRKPHVRHGCSAPWLHISAGERRSENIEDERERGKQEHREQQPGVLHARPSLRALHRSSATNPPSVSWRRVGGASG